MIMDKKGFISKYVQNIESKETSKMLQVKLVITDTSEKVPDPFHDIRGSGYRNRSSDDEQVIGTKYIIERADGKYSPVTVFIPDDPSLHARSDFFINTSFWVRCRYTQTALIAHPTRGYKDMSTLHPRWDVPSVASTLHKGV